ncbi:MAG: 50S ribosomal protein L10 [Rickettsia endosymbiont of Culicoides impunctatus]|uniref:50S ribosomal protein L10 n=1 Tax=unclassified Candidatus Tisiphia TaxID=2996318 RepID=UPI001DB70B49|nr:50S ribosomal protein L10 [Rickettsia endosymbiont of Platyusa sonomae]UCM86172.1 MAG: 50S ribosomal protein L10 [Rickettsia endosymbiont of Culicoides impunctatus]HJD56761.1 50S ribosomal protein L10 [Rickettsia endosymbiont of Sericostoma sp. HW-2014]HJD64141.1 50S ribosomal protein L10 [Rickettsia endosymbiont of Sericostoma sp.]
MLRSEKHEFVVELEEVYKRSNSVIITHYHGLTVSQVTTLRRSLKAKNVGFKVVKNTLSKIAANKAGIDNITHLFAGPTALAYSEDLVEAAKLIVEFAKANECLKIVGGLVNNQVLDVNSVQQLAKLPSLDELRGKIIGVLQAPATKIAGVIQAPASGLARVLQAYANKS